VHFSNRLRAPTWRKLLVALTIATMALPLFALPAGASSADQLRVQIYSPKPGDKVSGFVNVSFEVNPRNFVFVPRRREDNPYRAYSLSYAQGADVRDDGQFSVWRIDGGTISHKPGQSPGVRDNRNAYVQPGVGSIRPPRLGGFPWDSTLVPDGPATLRIRGFGYDGSFKDAYVTVTVENKGVTPDYTEMISPKSGDTVSGWVPVVFTAMPQFQGIQRGVRGSRFTTYLPSCLDTDLNFAKVEYASGSSPGDSDWRIWWYNSTGNATKIREQIQAGPNIPLRPSALTRINPVGCDSMYINKGGPWWDSTLVPDGPATLRVTVVFTDGSYRTFERVVNVQNNGKGNIYFGIDQSKIKNPISGDAWGVPGWANVPVQGVFKDTFQEPVSYYACEIAPGDVTKTPQDAAWAMFYVNDNTTWNEVRTANGWTIGGDNRLPDWSFPGYGPSGALCRLDTTGLPNGIYTIQLRLQLADGTAQKDWAVVEIKN